jgi:hypothetical protein
MNKSTSIAAAAIVIAIAGSVFYMSSSNAAKSPATPSSAASSGAGSGSMSAGGGGGDWTAAAGAEGGAHDVRRFRTDDGREFEWNSAGAAAGTGMPGERMEERRVAAINIDGHRVEFDPSDPASVEAAIAKAPADKQDAIRQALAKLQTDHPGPDLLGADVHGNIQADATEAAAMMKELIESGMTPEQAREVVAASLADSIQTRLAKTGSNAKVKTELMSATDGGEDRVGVMIMIDDDEMTDLPAPDGAQKVEKSNE